MTAPKTKIVVVQMLNGQSKRLNLANAIDLDCSENNIGVGIDLEGVYLMPRSLRVIVHSYSRWDNGHGRVGGHSWHEADNDQIADYARRFDETRLAALLPELSDDDGDSHRMYPGDS